MSGGILPARPAGNQARWSDDRPIAIFNAGWDQFASSAGPPSIKHRELLLVWRGEAPLASPSIEPSFKKALTLVERAQIHKRNRHAR